MAMKPKMLGSIAAMVLLGAAAFAILGVLVTSRMGTPLGPPRSIAESAPAAAQSIAVLSDGVKESVSIAVNALRTGDRSRSVRALDAAMRASEVGKHSGGGSPIATKFDEANRNIKEARIAVQDGRSREAAQLAGAALAVVETSNASSAEIPVQSTATDKYKGAKVLNARGVRVGEIRRVENNEAVISIGGVAGLFGFLHFGGKELRVPLDRVLLGEAKTIGSTFVVLPSLATAPDDIRSQVVADLRGQ